MGDDLTLGRESAAPEVADLAIPPGLVGPGLIGRVLEAVTDPVARRADGAHYTPAPIAASLLAAAWDCAADRLDGPGGPAGSGSFGGPGGSGGRGARDGPGGPAGWGSFGGPGGRYGQVCDPACGGGAFLLAAADHLLAAGHDPGDIVGRYLWGIDLDPVAVAVADAAVACWAWLAGDRSGARPGAHLAVADALLDPSPWVFPPAARRDPQPRFDREVDGFDLVIGNPPFQGQLARSTARTPLAAAALRDRLGPAVGAYTDSAALFLVAALDLVRPGGRVALIVPTSVLTARDAAGARDVATAEADLVGLWVAAESVFAANVRVCAPILQRRPSPIATALEADSPIVARPTGGPRRTAPSVPGPAEGGAGGGGATGDRRSTVVRPNARRRIDADSAPTNSAELSAEAPSRAVSRWRGRTFERLEPGRPAGPDQWGALALAAHGVPEVKIELGGRLGDLATATAGFRDQFYGLVPYVVEAPGDDGPDDLPLDLAPLITTGLVDLGGNSWGRRTCRFAGRVWSRPAVDLPALRQGDPILARWIDGRLVPKVLVASQTRVGEPAPDTTGRWVASVPLVSVMPRADQLWEVAAVIAAPPIAALALARAAGAALSDGAIKLSATQVRDLPLPTDPDAWRLGAQSLAAGHLHAFGRTMTAAYGLSPDDPVVAWWQARRP